MSQELLDLKDPSIDWDDFSTMKRLTCVNHPTARYLTKNPWARGLHFIEPCKEAYELGSDKARLAAGFTGPAHMECPCPFSDLRVVRRDEEDNE